MNKTQLQTTPAILVGAIAGFLAGKGYFGFDSQTWAAIIGAVVVAGTTVWGAIATRSQSLKDTVGKMPLTTVVTDKASADALPDNKDVVATTPALVKAVHEAQAQQG